MQSRRCHAGFRGLVSRNTLANANEQRDWQIYAGLSQVVMAQARRLYACDSFSVAIKQTAFALDSTTIELCLSLFPWTPFKLRKGAVKAHTLLDLRGNVPSFIGITTAHRSDVSVVDELPMEAATLHYGPRLYRFQAASQPHAVGCLLRGAHPRRHGLSPPLFASRG